MGGAGFILAINMFVAGLLSAAFMTIAVYDNRRDAAGWLAGSYLCGVAYFVAEFSIPFYPNVSHGVVVAFAVFLAATITFNIGLARKYGVKAPIWAMGLFFALATATVHVAEGLPRDSLLRMLINQLPYTAMQFAGAAIVLSSTLKREKLDYALVGLLFASGLQFASKPFLAMASGGSGESARVYMNTTYALISQSMGIVFAVAVALLMIVILVRDILSEATSKSETDPMSRLLNRAGFERHARSALKAAARTNMPVTLVISDLDHFKSINDNFGHATGDRVIETFGGFLRDAAADHHIAARLGGEEFAILLPGTNLVAARLFAEGARSAFGAMAIDGLPETRRCTASFGVAELIQGEGIAELMARADAALYDAKKGGRDCVRIAAPRRASMAAIAIER